MTSTCSAEMLWLPLLWNLKKKGKWTYDSFSSQILFVCFISHIPMNSKRLATFSKWWFIQWSQSRRYLAYIPWNLSERVARVPTCFCSETSSQIRRFLCPCTIDPTTAHHSEYCGIIKLLRNRIDNSVYLTIVWSIWKMRDTKKFLTSSNSKFDNILDMTLCIKYDRFSIGWS